MSISSLKNRVLKYIQKTVACLQLYGISNVGRIKLLIEWMFDASHRVLAGRITLKILKATWYCLRAVYERAIVKAISPRDTKNLAEFERSLLFVIVTCKQLSQSRLLRF